MTLSLRKNLSTEKTEIAVKWTFKFCCVYAPIAQFPQFCLHGQPATSQENLPLSGKDFLCQEKGEGDKKRTGSVCPQKQIIEGVVTM